MNQPSVSIELSVKFVDENHYEFTTSYGQGFTAEDSRSGAGRHNIQVVQGTSSAIGPGVSLPVGR